MNTLNHQVNNGSEMPNTSMPSLGAVQFGLECFYYRRGMCTMLNYESPLDQDSHTSRSNILRESKEKTISWKKLWKLPWLTSDL